jgi:hypothetical protein
MSSSIPDVNTDEAITSVPPQIKYKKTGCDAVEFFFAERIKGRGGGCQYASM